MTLDVSMMYEAKNTESPYPYARVYKEKEVAICRYSNRYYSDRCSCIAVIGAKSRFVVLGHEVASRKNRFGEKFKINIYRLLLDDGTIGWCMLPNSKFWKRVCSVNEKAK
jgi:hypothetical protein